MKKTLSNHITTVITLVIFSYAVYYFLLLDNGFHTSIAAIIASTHHMGIHEHLLVLAILPIYIGIVVFGAAVLGIYVGTKIKQLFRKRPKRLRKSK